MLYKVACFDLDGTLITNTNSVAYLCALNGRQEELDEIELMEEREEITWIEADYLKAKLMSGLDVFEIEKCFDDRIKLIGGIAETVKHLKEKGIKTLIITAGPVQVAEVVAGRFGFHRAYGSIYGLEGNMFTGELLEHLDAMGKLKCLECFCRDNGFNMEECAAIGDSLSDVSIFQKAGLSIAINYNDKVLGKAGHYIKTDNLTDLIKYF